MCAHQSEGLFNHGPPCKKDKDMFCVRGCIVYKKGSVGTCNHRRCDGLLGGVLMRCLLCRTAALS
jgi:hypothetical protein